MFARQMLRTTLAGSCALAVVVAPTSCGRDEATVARTPFIRPLETDGLPDLSRSYRMTLADINADGNDDLLIAHHQNPCLDKTDEIAADHGCPSEGVIPSTYDFDGIYLSTGTGSFEYSDQLFLRRADRHGCVAADFNIDGRIDVFCGIGGGKGKKTDKTDELFIAESDGTFVDRTDEWGLDDPARRSRLEVAADFNGDGFPDLFTTAGPAVLEGAESFSRLWLNDGGQGFVPAPSWGLDGYTYRGREHISLAGNASVLAFDSAENGLSAYRVVGQRFESIPMPPSWQGISTQIRLADVDGDDDPEFLVGLGEVGIGLFHPTTGESSLLETGVDVADIAAGDFDGDGHIDIFVLTAGSDCLSGSVKDYGGPNPETGQTGGVSGQHVVAFGPVFSEFKPFAHPMQGCGDAALSTDVDRDGDDEIVVSQGWGRSWGPYYIVDFTTSSMNEIKDYPNR